MTPATSAARRSLHGGEHALEKRSLASILRDHGPLSVSDAVDVTLDLCEELSRAHANGVVHGDLGLHRVRTHWPRVSGETVDIFALGEDDTAAFAFRASAAGILAAPEQRDGAMVDLRADVWAVGAILHWLIAGAPPSSGQRHPAIARSFAHTPRALLGAIEACLSEQPAKRPESVDAIAEAIGSFSSFPPGRFEQLARRRAAVHDASRVRARLGDVDRVLNRLDDAALDREVSAVSEFPRSNRLSVADRLMSTVERSVGSTVSDPRVPVTDLVAASLDAETVLAQPRYVAEQPVQLVTAPLSIAPVVLARDSLASASQAAVSMAPRATTTKSWPVVLAAIGAAGALAFGVGIGMRLVERAVAHHVAPPLVATSLAAAPPRASKVGITGATSTIAALPSADPSAASKTDAPIMTPASLPDALPDARPVTPAAPRPKPPASSARQHAAPKDFELDSSSLPNALR
jgi:serine/threonine-protein kinase